MFKYLRCYA